MGAAENDGVWNFVCNAVNSSFHMISAAIRNTSTSITVNDSTSTVSPFKTPSSATWTVVETSLSPSTTYIETSETWFHSTPVTSVPSSSSQIPSTTLPPSSPPSSASPPPPTPSSIAAGLPRTPPPRPSPPLPTPPVVVVPPQDTPSNGQLWSNRPGINVPVYVTSAASNPTHMGQWTLLAVVMALSMHFMYGSM